jgi:hypothetical protein
MRQSANLLTGVPVAKPNQEPEKLSQARPSASCLP